LTLKVLAGITLIETVAGAESLVPLLTLKVKLSKPV
jgi:hypothetical protein